MYLICGKLKKHAFHFFCKLKENGVLFHAVVLGGTLPSTDFKSIYNNQFKRYEYIQGIFEMQNLIKNTMTKQYLACAHFRARSGRIFCILDQNLMFFEFSQQDEIWRAPRAHPQFFFINVGLFIA